MATNRELSEWAAELGHPGARVVPGRRPDVWIGECRCGYKTTNRRNQAQAADSLIHHMYKVIRAAKAAGWVPSSTASSASDTPNRVKVRAAG